MHSDFIAVQGALAGEEVSYATLEVRGERARVTPAVPPSPLFAALNDRFHEAWGLEWRVESVSPPVVRCRMEFLGHAREGLGSASEVAEARRVALTEAARAWGLLPAPYHADAEWVEYDPEDGPNTSELGGAELSPAPAGAPEAPPADPQMVRARQHIDDLMDQLREQALGAQANRVLMKHKGYGETLEDSRRLYAELKALLKS